MIWMLSKSKWTIEWRQTVGLKHTADVNRRELSYDDDDNDMAVKIDRNSL